MGHTNELGIIGTVFSFIMSIKAAIEIDCVDTGERGGGYYNISRERYH